MDSKFKEQTQKWFDDGFKAGQQSKQAEIDAVKKTKVVHGGDFRDRW